jgi:hypothetical protein
MSVKLNCGGFDHAKQLIEDGKVVFHPPARHR